jgi:hypothetical protein
MELRRNEFGDSTATFSMAELRSSHPEIAEQLVDLIVDEQQNVPGVYDAEYLANIRAQANNLKNIEMVMYRDREEQEIIGYSDDVNEDDCQLMDMWYIGDVDMLSHLYGFFRAILIQVQ